MPQDIRVVTHEELFGRVHPRAKDPHRARPGETRKAIVKDGPRPGIKLVDFERVKKPETARPKHSLLKTLKIKSAPTTKKTVTKTVQPKKPSVTKAISKEQPQQPQPLTQEEGIARAKEIIQQANAAAAEAKRSAAQRQRVPASCVSPLDRILPKKVKPQRFWDVPRRAEVFITPYVPKILRDAGYSEWHLRTESEFSFTPEDFDFGLEFDPYGTNRHIFF